MNIREQDLPHDLDAERHLLGSILLAAQTGEGIAEARKIGLAANDFFSKAHRLIYGAILDLARQGIEPDIIAVKNWLETSGDLALAGGPRGLAELVN